MELLENFPSLPNAPPDNPWPADVVAAHDSLSNSYGSALNALNLDESDPIRLWYHLKRASDFMASLLEGLALRNKDPLPSLYIDSIALAVEGLICRLRETLKGAQQRQVDNAQVTNLEPVTAVYTGLRGRPRKVISPECLQEAFKPGRNISAANLASALGVHRRTVGNYSNFYGIHRQNYSDIREEDLDEIVRQYKERHPLTGIRYLRGYLLKQNLRVQRQRLLNSIQRIDALTKTFRKHAIIKRRTYQVTRPNALWHLDGHHKLIMYGIVIHGIADGYDRLLPAMEVATNNLPKTVLKLLEGAVERYGCPSRLRGDRGGENMDVSTYMVIRRGPNRASFMWGSSTHNTRIERMWVEVGRHFARSWRAFFTRLERHYFLDRQNPSHLWLLHQLFLSSIRDDCRQFVLTWNSHPISDKGHDMSPNDLRFLGQLKHGVYDDLDEVDPEILERFYGVTKKKPFRRAGETGAGHDDPLETDEERSQEILKQVSKGQEHQVRHEPIEVPESDSPFDNDLEAQAFFSAFEEVKSASLIPEGFGLLDPYIPSETFRTGRCRRGLTVPLPYERWYCRTLQWCQALDLLTRVPLVAAET